MLDQVIVALLGYPGHQIIQTNTGEFVLADRQNANGDFISISEKTLIEKIVRLGAICNRLQTFVTSTQKIQLRASLYDATASSGSLQNGQVAAASGQEHGKKVKDLNEDWRRSLYVSAFSTAVEKILKEYRDDVCALERKVVGAPNLPLSFLANELDKYQVIFPALEKTTITIQQNKLKGGSLLDACMERTRHGNPILRAVYKDLAAAVGGVWVRQLVSWIGFGQLTDYRQIAPALPTPNRPGLRRNLASIDTSGNEFFVRRTSDYCFEAQAQGGQILDNTQSQISPRYFQFQ